MSYGRGSSNRGQGSTSAGPGGISGPSEGIDYYGNIPGHWVPEETSPFSGIHAPYCTEPFPPGAVLTPISLPDGAFTHARSSPVASHHSQDYQYNMGVSVAQHGLGISAPFPPEYSQAMAPSLDYIRPDLGHTINMAPQPVQPAPVRRRRRSSRQAAPVRETPVTILPHPEGLQRLEQERQQSQMGTHLHQRLRSSRRGRRDPQMDEEDAFVWRLKEDEGRPWREITQCFHRKFGKATNEATLQMRLTRLRERLARWDENDIQILIHARDHFEREKFKFIARMMRELGATKSYSPEQCEVQLRALDKQISEQQASSHGSRKPGSMRPRKRARTVATAGD